MTPIIMRLVGSKRYIVTSKQNVISIDNCIDCGSVVAERKSTEFQTPVFLISRVWVRIPSRDTCVLKQDTLPLLRPSDGM